MITYVWKNTYRTSVPKLVKVIIPMKNRIYGNGEIRDWLEDNCQQPYYVIPSWKANGIEFEDEQDAVLFALRWS
jgi:hypothetical protein